MSPDLPTEMQGFILTRQWRDTPSGVSIELWLASDQGPVQLLVEGQESIFFIRQEDEERVKSIAKNIYGSSSRITIKPLPLKNTEGENLSGLYCSQQRQARQFSRHLQTEGVTCWESDIRPPERFLMERFVTSNLAFSSVSEMKSGSRFNARKNSHKYHTVHTNKVKPVDYKPSLKVASIDIETSMDAATLYSIAIYTDTQSLVLMVGDETSAVDDNDNMDIVWCSTAKQCLQKFIAWTTEFDPDIFIGWHVVQFDFWVLSQLCERWNVPLLLGRGRKKVHWREDGSSTLTSEPLGHSIGNADAGNTVLDNKRRYLTIPGRVVLDGIELLRTAFYHFDSFSLQFVANELLGDNKLLAHDDRGQAITELFEHDKLALARYNLHDCKLVWDIFSTTKLMDFAVERSRLTGLPMDKMGGSVASFEYAYLPRLHRKGYVAPNLGELQSDVVSPGGYVMNSIPGLYENVLVLDFKSLYPSIIRTFTIDPYAFWFACHQSLTGVDVVPGFNDANFSRHEYILPNIIRDLWQERDKAKKEKNKPLSQAIKIIMNSFYGVLGSTGCRFFDPRVCSSITLRGHEIIQVSHSWIEEQGYKVIYGDTDSLFVWLGEEFGDCSREEPMTAEEIGSSLAQSLNVWWTQRLKEKFDIVSALEIEFETHYRDFLMPTIRGSEKGSKKRYAGTIDKDGVKEMVFKGLETVRTDWTALAKDFQQQLYQMVFEKQEYRDYIQHVVNEVLQGLRDSDMIYQKRLRRPLLGYQKSNPPHVKAARKWESHAQKSMRRGDRINYVITLSGPEPIEYQQNPIDYQHYIDKQLKPIADSILCFLDDSFEKVTQKQLELLW